MSWYSKAWGSTKGYADRGYQGTLDMSAKHHWGWSAGTGSLGGAALGAGIGYGFGGGEGSAWGAGIGALGGAGGGYAFNKYLANAPGRQLSLPF